MWHASAIPCMLQATDEQLLVVGNRIVKSMRGVGTSVEWNSDPGETMLIKVMVQVVISDNGQ